MKEKIEKLNDSQLLKLAEELTKTTCEEDSIAREVIGGESFHFSVISLNACLVQELAVRLKEANDTIRVFDEDAAGADL